MSEFLSPIDICNRAMQHLGAKRIDPQLGFDEVSVQAGECAFAYGKLRRAELRRNYWRFAMRRTVLRPLNALAIQGASFVINPTVSGQPVSPTMLLSPALWSSTTTYPGGALVIDAANTIWQSLAPANIGFAPGNSSAWEQYAGPLTVDAYQVATNYFAGDLVYNAAGDGTYTVYQSLMNNNSATPTIPSPWSSAQVYEQDEVAIVYPAWASGTTYAAGAAVLYTDGNTYASLAAGNLNHAPSASPAQWALMPSPIAEWQNLTAYATGAVLDYSGTQYVAVATSTGVIPAGNLASWVPLSLGVLYQSIVNLNQGFSPPASATQWSTTITSGSGSVQWRTIPAALQPMVIMYPIGTGPSTQSATRNVFRLPNGYLREAPQDPKAGAISYLGVMGGLQFNDWTYDGDFITSTSSEPISYRFVADVTNVTKFDDMFCEALAARIAYEVCEPVTQSTAKQQACATAYKKFMDEASMVNSIEQGWVEPPLDDLIACRA